MDPEVVTRLLTHNTRDTRLESLTAREREVLGLMAQGRSNSSIAGTLVVSEKAVSKHINSILAKLQLPQSEDDNRQLPLHLMHFLEDARRRGILRQAGALYQFRHPRLQERLATRNDGNRNTANSKHD